MINSRRLRPSFPRTRATSPRSGFILRRKPQALPPALLIGVAVGTVFLGLLGLGQRDGCHNPSYARYMGSELCSARFTK